jgi:predicted DNA-binding protein with PD1-like motif
MAAATPAAFSSPALSKTAARRPSPRIPPPLRGVHEVVGTGTLFPNAQGQPILHVHLACGRGDRTVTGCIRTGVKTWHVLEVVLVELAGCTARRLPDAATGFDLLEP